MGLFLLSGAGAARTAHADVPAVAAPAIPSYSVTLTGYNAVPGQTDENPFETAAGTFSNSEIVAARSQDLAKELPFGTIIEITGPEKSSDTCGYRVVAPVIGYRVIEDTMNAKFTDRIDVLFSTHDNYVMGDGRTLNAGLVLGICKDVTIRVVGRLDLSHPDRLPKTQAALVAFVKGVPNSAPALALK